MAQAGSRPTGAQSTPQAQTQNPVATVADTATATTTTADARVKELEAENKALRAQLAAAGQAAMAKPHKPSFIAEGTREELERTGRAVDPFSGDRLVGSGKPGAKPRTVSADEFAKAKPVKPAGN